MVVCDHAPARESYALLCAHVSTINQAAAGNKDSNLCEALGTSPQVLHAHYEMSVFNHKMAFLYPAELHVCSGLPPQESAVVIAARHRLLSLPAACLLHMFCQQAYPKKSCLAVLFMSCVVLCSCFCLSFLATQFLQVFKALADGEEESIQPKKPKAEPQPRAPYVPKQPQASGQKRQGKQGSQQGPKGKKQKKGAAAADIEDAPPLPPSDAPPSDDSAAEADMEGVESVPLPPLPPPSPDSLPAGSAVANGYSSGHTDTYQVSVSGPLPDPSAQLPFAAPALPVTPPPPAEASDTPSRPQVGFKLQGNRRQKLHMVEGEDPTTKAMRERLQQHLAAQQQLQQLPQQLHQQQGGQLQSSLLQQAAQVPLPLPDSDTSTPGRRRSQRGNQGIQEPGHDQIPGIHDDTDGQIELETNGQLPFGKPQLQQVHQHRRHHPAAKHRAHNDSHAPPPGLEALPHQQTPQQLPQQVPQQLPQQLPQAELPLGLALETQQLQPQLQRSQSHRHVHHHRRSSRRSHRGDPAPLDMIQPSEEAPQDIAGLAPYSHPALQQSEYGTDPMTDPVTQEPIPEPDRSSTAPGYQQYEGQLAQPAVSQSAVAQAPAKGLENGLAGLAETGGPVALANGPAPGTQAGIQVLADDVKSLLRYGYLSVILLVAVQCG